MRPRLNFESLESRELLTATGGVGVDYTLMGGKWDNSQTITYSFPPDGVSWGSGTNNLNATLDAEFGGTSWQTLVADAFQVWAAATNLNFQLVPDGNYAFNTPGINEGDARFGDIRIGGFNLGSPTTIAQTYGPPPNGTTGAGDSMLNISMSFGPGSPYDFETVMIHEIGHALGLGESPQPGSVMYSYYSGVHHSLSDYDIEGIQSLYGARTSDSYQSQGQATSPSTALNLTSYLNSNNQTQLSGLDLSSIGDTEYFSVVAPAINGSTLMVAAQPAGYSQLSPKVTVFDPTTGATLATASNPSANSDRVIVSVPGAVAGHPYLIAVTGATNDNFAVGSYALQLGFFGGTAISPSPTNPTPVQSNPVTTVPTPTPPAPTIQPDAYAYNTSFANANQLGSVGLTTAANLTLPSGQNYQVFGFTVKQAGTVLVAAGNVNVVIGDSSSRPIASGTGLIMFYAPTAGAKYYLLFLSSNQAPVANYGFAVRLVPATTAKQTVSAAAVATPTAATTATVVAKAKIAAVKTKVMTRPNQ